MKRRVYDMGARRSAQYEPLRKKSSIVKENQFEN